MIVFLFNRNTWFEVVSLCSFPTTITITPRAPLLEIIYGVTFYMPRDWLKNNQSRAAISTFAIPPHVHTLFKLTSLYPFHATNVTRNLDCWRIRPPVTTACGALYTRTVIQWETLRTRGPEILLFQAFEFVQTGHQNYRKLKTPPPKKKTVTKTSFLFAIILLF